MTRISGLITPRGPAHANRVSNAAPMPGAILVAFHVLDERDPKGRYVLTLTTGVFRIFRLLAGDRDSSLQ